MVDRCTNNQSNKREWEMALELISERGPLAEVKFQNDVAFPGTHFYILPIFYIRTFCVS